MPPAQQLVRWEKGEVDRTKEHFELRFGSSKADGGWSDWIPVALIGPPVGGCVIVEFLLGPENTRNAVMIADAIKDIQLYFFELKEADPWAYAQYHCGTMSNMYSAVHWSFFRPEAETKTSEGKH